MDLSPQLMEIPRFIQRATALLPAQGSQLPLTILPIPLVMEIPQFIPLQAMAPVPPTPDHLHPLQVLAQALRRLLETTRGLMDPSPVSSSKPGFRFESCIPHKKEER